MTDDHRIAALDIGGTRIKAGLFEGMKLVQTAETDTPAKEGAKALLKAAGDLLDSFVRSGNARRHGQLLGHCFLG